jgi:hypothetical protein
MNGPTDQQDASGAATLTDVINAAAERIHYAEGRRTNFTIAASVLIAGGVALFTSVYDKAISLTAWYMLIAGSLSSILVGAGVLLAYALQTNRYPWTEATKTWKWFYRDALPESSKFDIGWRDLLSFKKAKPRVQAEYNRQLPLFQKKMNALSLPGVSYRQDLQQLYVLHINDKYKNLHLSQLRTILGCGIIGVIIATALGATFGVWRDTQFTKVYRGEVQRQGYIFKMEWHRNALGAGSEALVTANLINRSNGPIQLPTWEPSDEDQNPLPAELNCTTKPGSIVPPRQSVKYSCLIRPYERAHISKLWAKRL